MIIDTNVYSALDKGTQTAIEVIRDQSMLFVPIFVIAELRYGFENGAKKAENEQQLTRFLAQNGIEVLLPNNKTTECYARLATYCRRAGRALSHNDIWIAALSLSYDDRLATFDKDFAVLEPLLGDRLILLEDK